MDIQKRWIKNFMEVLDATNAIKLLLLYLEIIKFNLDN